MGKLSKNEADESKDNYKLKKINKQKKNPLQKHTKSHLNVSISNYPRNRRNFITSCMKIESCLTDVR